MLVVAALPAVAAQPAALRTALPVPAAALRALEALQKIPALPVEIALPACTAGAASGAAGAESGAGSGTVSASKFPYAKCVFAQLLIRL